MIKLLENKVVILNSGGEYFTYSKKGKKTREDFIKEYTKKNAKTSDIDYVVKRGNVVFTIEGEKVTTYMPKSLTDEQLYNLELMIIWMDDVKQMMVVKDSEERELVDNVGDRFSREVIQSYFAENSKVKSK